MRKWWIAFVAAALAIGCGGGGGGGGTGGPGGPGGGPGGGGPAVVTLPSSADVQVLFLSGAGRRAVGSQYAIMDIIKVQNSPTDFVPATPSGSPLSIQLDGYTINSFDFTVNLPAGTNSKAFTQFPLQVDRIREEDAFGGLTTVFSGPPFIVSPPLDIQMTLFPGRQSSLVVKLDQDILRYDSGSSSVIFDRVAFEQINYDPVDDKMIAFLGDHVAFDVTAMSNANRPNMLSGQPANMVLFSGDQIAISRGYDSVGSFNLLRPILIEEGTFKAPVIIAGNETPGTYTVVEPDPRDVFSLPPITSLQGRWMDWKKTVSNATNNVMLVFPNSRNSNEQQVVLFNTNGAGNVTAMWQGVAKFSGGSASLELWSIDQLEEGTANNTATGTLSGFTSVGGVVKSGTFTITNNPVGFPFANTGDFAVYRK